MSHSQDFTANVHQALSLTNELLNHIEQFDLKKLMYRSPISDRIKFEPWGQEDMMGFKKWLDGIYNHAKLLEAMIASGIPPKDDPLPTVNNLITFWKIILTSTSPIVGIKMSMGGDKRLINGFGNGDLKNKSSNNKSFIKKDKSKKAISKEKQKEKEVWVDVISNGGREWIRIYSKKISHLLAEFREADSYINSDYDSDSTASSSTSRQPKTKSPIELDNTLIQTAKDLLRAASLVDRIPGGPIPKVTIYLTRIPSSPSGFNLNQENEDENEDDSGPDWPDDRIPLTFEKIREMGVELKFGDLSEIPLSKVKGPEIPLDSIPSLKLNLDITTLMGLCSDVLHYPLPLTKEEAAKRSLRPTNHLIGDSSKVLPRGRDGTGKGRNKGKQEQEELEAEDSKDEFSSDYELFKGQSQNSIELYRCILEEMERPFIEEFNQVIEDAWKDELKRRETERVPDINSLSENIEKNLRVKSNSPLKVEFWTTKEAAQYTYEALSSGPAHGHGLEQRRMRRLLGLEKGDFFEESRYKGKEGYLKDIKINIFDLDDDKEFKPQSVEQVLEDAQKRGKNYIDSFQTSSKANATSNDNGLTGDSLKEEEKTGFHHTLATITELFLNQYYNSLVNPSTDKQDNISKDEDDDVDLSLNPRIKHQNKFILSKQTSISTSGLPNFLQPRKLPTPPIAKISLPFPVVSLHSLNKGSLNGMTTIMMGTATLKEVWSQNLWRIRGWERGWYNWQGRENSQRERGYTSVIIFPYRVFGEGKRVRFEKGDYSYPTKDWWEINPQEEI
ncbi:uncharacterized protein L201_006605 [Kwoniella dendrophila CBS 6074]|uniref:Uncharacterized protein n=1 Tax=Kwoniella dendrophila CBS 6074 TaxID=1295534 RepID=A0AAX4K3I4_9TREE